MRLAGILAQDRLRDATAPTTTSPTATRPAGASTSTPSINISLATLKLGAVYGRGHRDLHERRRHGPCARRPTIRAAAATVILVPSAEAVKLFGMSAYVDFNWSKQWTSRSATASTRSTTPTSRTTAPSTRAHYASVNLLWHSGRQRAHRRRAAVGQAHRQRRQHRHDLRFQYSFHWDFSSKNIWSVFD